MTFAARITNMQSYNSMNDGYNNIWTSNSNSSKRNGRGKTLPQLNTMDVPVYRVRSGERGKNVVANVVVDNYDMPFSTKEESSTSFSIHEKLEMLRFAFPDIEASFLEDVFAGKNYDLADTAEVLSAFASDQQEIEEEYQVISMDCEFDNLESVNEWVVVPEENEFPISDRVPTYSEVLRTPYNQKSHQSDVLKPFSLSNSKRENNESSSENSQETSSHSNQSHWYWKFDDIWSMKSFGERRVKNNMKHKKRNK